MGKGAIYKSPNAKTELIFRLNHIGNGFKHLCALEEF